MAGTGEACGLRQKYTGSSLRDKASADAFCTPGKCRAVTVMFRIVHRRVRRRIKCMRAGSRADPLLTAATTAALSQRQQTFGGPAEPLPLQLEPAPWAQLAPVPSLAATLPGTTDCGTPLHSPMIPMRPMSYAERAGGMASG